MRRPARGFTLLELMIAMALGLIVIAGILTVFAALRRVDRTALAQAAVQNADNAISAALEPAIRGAGFGGCSTLASAMASDIDTTSAITNVYGTPVQGFDATGTPGTTTGKGTNTLAMATDDAANDASRTDWTPNLNADLPLPEPGSDVLVVSGEMPGTAPASVNAITDGADDFTVTDNASANAAATLTATGLPAPAALSDCGKSIVFMVTAMSGSGNALQLTHDATGSGNDNINAALQADFAPGAQFVPLQQSAFYVAQGAGGQSALYRATVVGGKWVGRPLVPGVENMQALYDVVTGGTHQWVPAGAVLDWKAVDAVRLGFLVEGGVGSNRLAAQASFNVIGTTVTVPRDTRLRHVFVMNAYLRNATL